MKNSIEFKLEQVKSSYSGKAKACCCGCSGGHHYNVPEHSRAVKLAYNAMMKALKDAEPMDFDCSVMKAKFKSKDGQIIEMCGDYIARENETRLNILYFS